MPSINQQPLEPTQNVANAVSQDSVQLEILQLLKDIRADMKQTTNAITPKNPKGNSSTTKNPRITVKPGFKTPDDFRGRRWKTHKYCWTHGACGHGSSDCVQKAEGHKDEATFQNRMGGSNACCR